MGRLGPEELSPQTIQFRAPLAGVWQRLAGKLPLPKPEVRAEGEGASVQCSHTRSKGETEAQRGAGPCPGSHSGFLFCLHSQHCKIRASPTPRELGWVGGRKVAQRRHRPPPSGQCRSPGAFRTAPESRRPPTLKVTSILWTLQVASCKRKDEGTEGRAHARRLWDREVALSPFPTHSSPWGSWRSLPALRALGDFHSLVLPSTRGDASLDSRLNRTRLSRAWGPPTAKGDSRVAATGWVSPGKEHPRLKNGVKNVCLGGSLLERTATAGGPIGRESGQGPGRRRREGASAALTAPSPAGGARRRPRRRAQARARGARAARASAPAARRWAAGGARSSGGHAGRPAASRRSGTPGTCRGARPCAGARGYAVWTTG